MNHASQSILQPFLRNPFRVTGRLAWLIAEFFRGAFAYVVHVAFRQGDSHHWVRGNWLRQTCRRVLRVLSVELDISGPVPTRGLLVSNHLSYLDILLIGAVTPAVFVAKREVRSWPVIGWLARLAGTVFVRRDRRIDAGRATAKIADALNHGALVVLFPEGTSSSGETVLPFKSTLLAPATQQERLLSAGFIRYAIEEGSVSEEICYWRDMTLLPHLLNLLGKRGVSAHVSFTQLQHPSPDRKELARQLYSEVIRLKEQSSGSLSTAWMLKTARRGELGPRSLHRRRFSEADSLLKNARSS